MPSCRKLGPDEWAHDGSCFREGHDNSWDRNSQWGDVVMDGNAQGTPECVAHMVGRTGRTLT